MAEITRGTSVSPCTTLPDDPNRLPPLPVGADIAAGDACYIKTSDGKVYPATGAAANAAAVVDGFAPQAALVAQRQTVSLYVDTNFNYGAGLSPGTMLYLSGTVAGGLATATSTGGLTPVGRVIDANRVRLRRSF